MCNFEPYEIETSNQIMMYYLLFINEAISIDIGVDFLD